MKKNTQFFAAAALTACSAFALPRAEVTSFDQNGATATITYTLTEASAIVTVDIQTNVTGDVWASIGGENIVNGISADSDVFKKVSETGPLTIKWTPNRAWADHNQIAGKVRAVVTAHSLANPPDYMAVDLTEHAQPNTQRYYPGADFVPGGVTNCTTYRTSMLLMRRIHARNKMFDMGSIGEYGRNTDNERTNPVTLTNDYYIGVFEVTQAQWFLIKGNWPSGWNNAAYREMRPVGKVSYCDIRMWTDNKYYATMDFPNPPYEGSFLYKLRARTGIDFDLPGEAQWEFACRAGHGEGEWGNGAKYDYLGVVASAPISLGVGRTKANVASSGSGPEAGPAICGSYPPNDWGLYDMHGNISEWCLDWFTAYVNLDYQVNIDPAKPAKRLSDGEDGTAKVRRGGSYDHAIHLARSADRNKDGPATRWDPIGFRVICPVEAK